MDIYYELLIEQLRLLKMLHSAEDNKVTIRLFKPPALVEIFLDKYDMSGSLIRQLRKRNMFATARILVDLQGVIATNLKASAYVLKHMPKAEADEKWMSCNRCDSLVLKSELEQYSYQCFACDEDLFGIEVKEVKSKYLLKYLIKEISQDDFLMREVERK